MNWMVKYYTYKNMLNQYFQTLLGRSVLHNTTPHKPLFTVLSHDTTLLDDNEIMTEEKAWSLGNLLILIGMKEDDKG